jgi:hypothetical protein
MNLSTEDLQRTLSDERHLGWGYACCGDIESESTKERLDRAVVAVANDLGLDYEVLFHWSNSKYGRWLADGIIGCGESATRATVRRYLNPDAITAATEGVEALGEAI